MEAIKARMKAMRQMILSRTHKLEHFNENKSYYVKEDLADFPEEDSEDCKSPSRKRAKLSISSLTGKNFSWLMESTERKFTRLRFKPNFSAKGKGTAESISSPIEAWSLLFSDNLLNLILKCTNIEIENRNKFHEVSSYHNLLDVSELKAFIGLLYYTGLAKKKVSIPNMFSVHGSLLFREITSKNRLKFLLESLLFDVKTTRDERYKINCFAEIDEIWHLFITNCIQYYEPGNNVTIGEQILSFHGKCPTGMRLSYKRDKCGLKFVTMNDSETFYMINAIPYIDNETKPLGRFPSYYVNEISADL